MTFAKRVPFDATKTVIDVEYVIAKGKCHVTFFDSGDGSGGAVNRQCHTN